MIDKNELLELTQQLVKIKSPFFEEEDITKYLIRWLEKNKFKYIVHEYEEMEVTKFKGKNLLCEVKGTSEGPTILFNGHMDTVLESEGWTRDPYGGEIIDNKLYGIGSLDMKAGLAAMLIAVKEFKERNNNFKGNIKLHIVSDEEGPFGLGTDAIINDGICNADVAIVPEPSAGFLGKENMTVCLGARGGLVYTVEVTGESAHVATPELGINPIVEISKIIMELDKLEPVEDPLLGKSSTAIISIEGGDSPASTSDKAKFTVFKHIVRGETKDTIINEVMSCAKKAGVDKDRIKINFRKAPSKGTEMFMPYVSDKRNQFIREFIDVSMSVDENTEIGYFPSMGDFNYLGSRTDIPTIVFGPSGKRYHSFDEFVDIDSLYIVAKTFYKYLENLLLS